MNIFSGLTATAEDGLNAGISREGARDHWFDLTGVPCGKQSVQGYGTYMTWSLLE